jgi:hypothetical protein
MIGQKERDFLETIYSLVKIGNHDFSEVYLDFKRSPKDINPDNDMDNFAEWIDEEIARRDVPDCPHEHIRIYVYKKRPFTEFDVELCYQLTGMVIVHETLHPIINDIGFLDRIEKRVYGHRSHRVMACGMDQFEGKGYEYYLWQEFPKSTEFVRNNK